MGWVTGTSSRPLPEGLSATSFGAPRVTKVSTRPTLCEICRFLASLGTSVAKLAGVSGLTVYTWEKPDGRINPRGRALAGLAKVMGMGKREAKKALADVVKGE